MVAIAVGAAQWRPVVLITATVTLVASVSYVGAR